MLFMNTLKALFINHMLVSATKSFSDIVMSGKMIENTVRSGKIDAGENTKRSALRKKENEVNNAGIYNKGYSKPITVGQPRTVTTSHQGPQGKNPTPGQIQKGSSSHPSRELYQSLFDAHVVSPFYLKPMQPPFPKWYNANAQCKHHARITGHSIKNCTIFKKLIERFIKMRIVKFDETSRPNVAGNSLPSHSDKGVNVIIKSGGKRTKIDVAEVKTPLRWVWKKLVEGRLIIQDSNERPEGMRNYYEFHAKEGHEIQECIEFRALVQNLMYNKEIKFYEEVKGTREGDICALKERSTKKVHKKPVAFPYKDSKRVPWNYDCNVTILGEENPVSTSEEGQNVGFHTHSGRRYDPVNIRADLVKGKASVVEQKKEKTAILESPVNEPVTEKEVKEFLKFLKHNEYSVVEQLQKQPARISVLALLLS
ncbi:hypothetical protein EPI10_021567 [Gossypium australe]|uniref:Uncharacterized protein n=1 Tax=Gossypium australe TaxID=47621 RepID=A0A5B6WK26_9ROSI|nr:hypothetical protein EPI10_021567 [Gossypium australe]